MMHRALSDIGSTKVNGLSVMDGVGGMMLCGLAAAPREAGENRDMGTEEVMVSVVVVEEDGMETADAEMEEVVMEVEEAAAEVNKRTLEVCLSPFQHVLGVLTWEQDLQDPQTL